MPSLEVKTITIYTGRDRPPKLGLPDPVKDPSSGHLVDESCLCLSRMLAGRLFVEVTGAAVKHQDVLYRQSARLSSQQRCCTHCKKYPPQKLDYYQQSVIEIFRTSLNIPVQIE